MSLTTTATDTAQPPQFTAAQVAEHNDPHKDNWIIVHGQVLDISQYIQDHPGGADVLLEVAGEDATEAFDNAGHSEDALEIMAEFCVGALEGYKKPAPKRTVHVVAPKASKPAPAPRNTFTPPSQASSTSSPVKTATAVAIGALATLSATYCFQPGNNSALSVSSARLVLANAQKVVRKVFSHLQHNVNGFPAGFLAASAISAVVGAAVAKQLSRLTDIEHGFTRFPPRKPLAKMPPRPDTTFLDPKTFQSLPLVRKDEIAPSVFRLVFALPTPDTVLGLPTGQHVAIKAEVDGKVVQRSYTPTSNDSDRGILELVIRCYPSGLLTGQYLARLQPGVDSVLFRGPKGAMKYRRGLAKRIGMVAGGTGITPMYQVIRAICEDPEDDTEVSLVYANRSEGDILCREELEGFAKKYPQNLKLWYMLDSAPEHGHWAYGTGFVTAAVLEEKMPKAAADSKVFLCGPPGMVNAAKKCLGGLGYAMPGAVGKMDDQVFCF